MDNRSCFIFTHIPKCGGSSFREYLNQSALQSGIKRSEIYIPTQNGIPARRNYDQLNGFQKNFWKRKSYRVIAMHCTYGIHKHLKQTVTPCYYVILRDPIQRFLSHYNHFMFRQGNLGLKGVHLNDLSSQDLDKICQKIANLQVRVVAGEVSHLNKEYLSNEKSLELAKRNLIQKYHGYGILELLDASLNRLTYENIIFENHSQFPKINVSNKCVDTREINDSVIDVISHYHQLDIQLYQFAIERF